jgi:hypothetical protein
MSTATIHHYVGGTLQPPIPKTSPLDDGSHLFVCVAALRGRDARRLTKQCSTYKEARTMSLAASALGMLVGISVRKA